MPLPKIEGQNLKKPLSYDRARKRFLFFEEIVSGQEKIVPLSQLSISELKRLVIERQRQSPDYTVQTITGRRYSRDDVIKAIERDEAFGKVTLEAEASYLQELLKQIQDYLNQKSG
jgi:hypothetical protein